MRSVQPRVRLAVAGSALILLIAAWVLLGFIIHIASFVLSTLVFVAAVVAVVWALRILL